MMSINKQSILLTLSLLLFGMQALFGQSKELEELKNILQKASKNISNVKSAHYKITYRSDDERDNEPIIMGGEVYFKKINVDDELGVKTKINGKRITHDDTLSFDVYYNGKKEFVVGHKETKVLINERPAILTGNVLGQLVDNILISNHAFDSTLAKSSNHEMFKSEKVSGEPCYVFTVYFPDSKYLKNINDTWYISKNDYLPRKHVDRYSYNGKKKVITYQFENLNVNPELPDSLFTLSPPPAGYDIEWSKDRVRKKIPELLKIGSEAPLWTLKNGKNEEVSLEDYKGQIVILDFWGTWCMPCLEAMPELQHIHEKFDEVTVLGASTNEPANAEPVVFARGRDISYPILLHGEKIIGEYHVSAFPTFYIIGKNGKIIYRTAGYGEGTGKKIEEGLKGKL